MKYLPRDNPNLYEINAAAWLLELSQRQGETVNLGNIPVAEWDKVKAAGMDYIWLMGIWKRSPQSCQIFLNSDQLRISAESSSPGFKVEDIKGSPYAVQAYEPDPSLGVWEDLSKIHNLLRQRNMGLILDFVPNHTATDHLWVSEHPEYYILGNLQDLRNRPESFFRAEARGQTYIIAHGRDPNFPAWTDTAQLNFNNQFTRTALVKEVQHISQYCDGLRCDMAMLMINDIFQRDWGQNDRLTNPQREFWRDLIDSVPDLVYLAEAYWDTEWALQHMGFDFVYDKRLYDRLKSGPAVDVFLHLKASMDYQNKLVRFIENHDEQRSIEAFGPAKVKTAATLFSMLPGLKLIFHGQLEGKRNKLPVQLCRLQNEPKNPELELFYQKLLSSTNDKVAHSGVWKLKTVYPHADNNSGNLIAYTRQIDQDIKLVIVNLSPQPAQGRIVFQDDIQEGVDFLFLDRLNGESFKRKGVWMAHPGLIFELTGYQARLFEIRQV
jgi:glycosidase